jgi:hypothetical protein
MDSATKEFLNKIIHELEHLNRTLNSFLKLANRPGQHDIPHDENEDGNGQQDERIVSSATATNFGSRQHTADKPQYKKYDARYWASKPLRWWKPRLETIAVFFAVGYAVVTYFQWRDSVRNFLTDERAWIAPHGVTPHKPYIASHLAITIRYENTGKTPGYIDSIVTRVGFATPTQINWVDTRKAGSEAMAPNQEIPVTTVAKPISDAEFQMIENGKMGLAFDTTVYYHDVFGKFRTTESCVVLTGHIEDLTEGQILPVCGSTKMT